MRTLSLLSLLAFAGHVAGAAPERLLILPLNPAAVSLDSVATAELPAPADGRDTDLAAESRVARSFHPVFGAAVATAARRVVVIDRTAPGSGVLPSDSVRYLLTIESLAVTGQSRASARRFVPPEPAGFDPATGTMTTGSRRGHMEGPGLATTITAHAVWSLRDLETDSLSLRGEADARARFRGDAERAQWEHMARNLALTILRATPFAP